MVSHWYHGATCVIRGAIPASETLVFRCDFCVQHDISQRYLAAISAWEHLMGWLMCVLSICMQITVSVDVRSVVLTVIFGILWRLIDVIIQITAGEIDQHSPEKAFLKEASWPSIVFAKNYSRFAYCFVRLFIVSSFCISVAV